MTTYLMRCLVIEVSFYIVCTNLKKCNSTFRYVLYQIIFSFIDFFLYFTLCIGFIFHCSYEWSFFIMWNISWNAMLIKNWYCLPWIEFNYVKSFYVKYRMFSFMRGVSFRVSGTRLSMLADKNNKWIWLEKNIIAMQYIHTSCPKEQKKHVKCFYRI